MPFANCFGLRSDCVVDYAVLGKTFRRIAKPISRLFIIFGINPAMVEWPNSCIDAGMAKTIGQQILETLEAKDLDIDAVAGYAGISVSELRDVITGEAVNYSLDELCRIASALGKVLGFCTTFRADGSCQSSMELRDVPSE